MDLRGKKVAVVGLGRSGLAACRLLLQKGARVSITDSQDNPRIRANIRTLKGMVPGQIELGRHTGDLIKQQDLVVVSPGVSQEARPVRWARARGIPVIGEIELAFAFCPAPIIAITGTNGKTTVCRLLGEIFQQAGRRSVVCGNIGTPFSAEVSRINSEDVVVLEVSSFQLETIDRFKPKVAVVLNISCDHLDRYKDFSEYLLAKSRIFSNQDQEDWALFNRRDRCRMSLAKKTKARILDFPPEEILDKRQQGFNDNHFAALAVSSLFAISPSVAVNTCIRFKGVEHRLEQVAEIEGIKFINDSKATNVHSCLWALDAVKEPIILIAGGRDKNMDFTLAREKVKERVKAMVLLGEARKKLEQAFGDLVLIKNAEDLAEATRLAFALAGAGDSVLLSPMCASFDMFADYEDRGRLFKQAVHNLGTVPG